MQNPFFRNRGWYQQPEMNHYPYSHSPSFGGVPVYQVDPSWESHLPSRPSQRLPERGPAEKVVRIPVQFVRPEQVDRSGSALKMQKAFRGFWVRKCLKKIKDIEVQVDAIEERLLNCEVVELVRRDEKERLKMNESLMSLLFKLDSICGVDFGVRSLRKAVIRKAIALQERIDAIAAIDLEGNDGNGGTNDQETEIRVSADMESSNQSDDPAKSQDPLEKADNLEGPVENPEPLEDASCVGGHHRTMEVEGNDEEAEIIDVGLDCEAKVGEANCVGNVDPEKLGSILDGAEKVKEISSYGAEKDKSGDRVELEDEGKPKEEGNGVQDNRRNQDLLERMKEDNEKMMSLLTQLFDRNETQTRMLNDITRRVELLEKAFVCDKLRKKQKKAASRGDN